MTQTFIKIMSKQDMADSTHNKDYTLLTVSGDAVIEFTNRPRPLLYVNGDEYQVTGNVYVMSQSGNTISTFTPSNVVEENINNSEIIETSIGFNAPNENGHDVTSHFASTSDELERPPSYIKRSEIVTNDEGTFYASWGFTETFRYSARDIKMKGIKTISLPATVFGAEYICPKTGLNVVTYKENELKTLGGTLEKQVYLLQQWQVDHKLKSTA